MATAVKCVQPIPIFLAYLVPLNVDVVPNKFHHFLFSYDHFCVFQIFSILAVSMATEAILEITESDRQLHLESIAKIH